MRLANLSPDELDFFVEAVARNRKISVAVRGLYDSFEDVHEYTYEAFLKFARSEEGKAAISAARKNISETIKDLPYVQRPERLDALVETFVGVFNIFRDEIAKDKPSPKAVATLAAEIRQLIESIEKHSAPYDDTPQATLSGMEVIAKMLESAPDVVAALAKHTTPSNLIPEAKEDSSESGTVGADARRDSQ